MDLWPDWAYGSHPLISNHACTYKLSFYAFGRLLFPSGSLPPQSNPKYGPERLEWLRGTCTYECESRCTTALRWAWLRLKRHRKLFPAQFRSPGLDLHRRKATIRALPLHACSSLIYSFTSWNLYHHLVAKNLKAVQKKIESGKVCDTLKHKKKLKY